MKEIQIIQYEATDGQCFDDKEECQVYENHLEKEDIFLVFSDMVPRYDKNYITAFSSRKLAEESIEKVLPKYHHLYEIKQLKID